MRNTSYPAIALLVSVFILITSFALLVVGYNNYLEEQRKVGKEILEEFTKYNVFQYYLYVLSDYEARKAFFNALYDVFTNSIRDDRYINISKLNEGIIGDPGKCENFTDYVIIGNTLVIYPCIEPIPLFNFQNNLNKSFIESIINSFKPEEHLNSIIDFYGVNIVQSKKDYFIGNDYFNLYQEVDYTYVSETYNRRLSIGVNYSLIPSIFIYNLLLAKEYEFFYDEYIKFLKKVYGGYNHPIYNYGSVDKFFENFKITYSKRVDSYVLIFNKSSNKFLREIENFLRIYLLDKAKDESLLTLHFKTILEYPMFCWHFGQREFSIRYSDNIYYEDKNGCEIAAFNTPKRYKYVVEECLLPDSSYRDGRFDEMDKVYVRLTFHNFSFKEPEIFKLPPTQPYKTYLGGSPEDVESKYSDYLWPVGGKYNVLTLVKIGEFKPITCVLGEKVYNETFTNEDDCMKKYDLLAKSRNPYIEIRKVCECTKKRTECETFCGGEGCVTICWEVCEEYLLEWAERLRNVSKDFTPELSLAIYYPYYDIEKYLKYLISS